MNDVQIGELAPADSAFRVYALGLPLAAVTQVCTAPSTSRHRDRAPSCRPAMRAVPIARELGLAVDWVEVAPDAGRNSA